MTYQVLDSGGAPIDAHLEVDTWGLTLHSRGGSKETAKARNTDYGLALKLMLTRIRDARMPVMAVWVDSSQVQALPLSRRIVLAGDDLMQDVDAVYSLASRRMMSVGRKSSEGGNPTKRLRIQFAEEQDKVELTKTLMVRQVARDFRSLDRLPREELALVTPLNIWKAVENLVANPRDHRFGESTDFDLITESGDRLPPKAVFGLAASEALGFEVLPRHFTGGRDTICFRTLEAAGYTIVPGGASPSSSGIQISPEDEEWAEGKKRLITHLRRERAAGLSKAKKESFIKRHGRLFCERCKLDPLESFGGPEGLACIEVHHNHTLVQNMGAAHRTKLEHLQCVCANCHRFIHRLMKNQAAR